MNLALVDLGYGNLASVVMAFERLGVTPLLTGDPALVARADRVVLPGVGAAGFAMRRIAELGLAESLRARTAPSLGICLGMQLLFERSEEADVSCLGLIEGAVRRLDAAPRRPVPHMGWSRLSDVEAGLGLAEGDYVYFAHGFACDDGPASVAVVQYGRRIAAAARRGAWLGAQFHPERSAGPGARFLEAFLAL